eukprot:GFKZ01000262.1.p1 GENE.GFKZ01000262.1~~GFKZ01000262.1.p1  ORF type:complete len:757 (+),score=100.59 GFKZ01000262.1:97-2271(+)
MTSPQRMTDPQINVASPQVMPEGIVTTTPCLDNDQGKVESTDTPLPDVPQMPDQTDGTDSKPNDSECSSESDSGSGSESDSGSESESESDSGSSNVESDIDSTDEEVQKDAGKKAKGTDVERDSPGDDEHSPSEMRTKNEVDEDNIQIARPDIPEVDANAELIPVGEVTSVMDNKVVVMSTEALNVVNGKSSRTDMNEDDMVAWDEGSLLVVNGRKVLGKIHETFGPVWGPMYLVRFNSNEEIEAIGDLSEGTKVWGVREKMMKVRVGDIRTPGCDGSNIWDEEGGELAFSDDEKERQATKRANRGSGGGGKRGRLSRGGRGSNSERRSTAAQDISKRRGSSHTGRHGPHAGDGNLGPHIRVSIPRLMRERDARGASAVNTHATSRMHAHGGIALSDAPNYPVQPFQPVPGFGQWTQVMQTPGQPQPMQGPMGSGNNSWNVPPGHTGMHIGGCQEQTGQQWYAIGGGVLSSQPPNMQQAHSAGAGFRMNQSQYAPQGYDQPNSMIARYQASATSPMNQTQYTGQIFCRQDGGGSNQPSAASNDYTMPGSSALDGQQYSSQEYETLGNVGMNQERYVPQEHTVVGSAPTSHFPNSYQGYVPPLNNNLQPAQHSRQEYAMAVGPAMGQPPLMQARYGEVGSSAMNHFYNVEPGYGDDRSAGREYRRLNAQQQYDVGGMMHAGQRGHSDVRSDEYREYDAVPVSQVYTGNDGNDQDQQFGDGRRRIC